MPTQFLGTADIALFNAVFAALPDCPFFIKDRDLRYAAANNAMATLCGRTHGRDLVGLTAQDLFPPALADRYEGLDRQVLASGRAMTGRLDATLTGRARTAWLLFSRTPVRDEAGAVVGLVGSAQRLPSVDRKSPTYARLATVVAKIEAEVAQPLRLGALAALAGTSTSQLERDFKTLFGVSPQDHLHKCRIERACRLLAGPGSVAAIAQACGYADHSAFTRRFRALTGVTPRQYRQRLRD